MSHTGHGHDLIWQPEIDSLAMSISPPVDVMSLIDTYRPMSYIFHYLPTLVQDVHPIFSH